MIVLLLSLTVTLCTQVANLAALRDKHARSREKSGVLKENNRLLSDQVAQLQSSLEAQDAQFRQLERQLKLELNRLTTVRST